MSSAVCLCSACTVQPPFPTRYTLKNNTGRLLSKSVLNSMFHSRLCPLLTMEHCLLSTKMSRDKVSRFRNTNLTRRNAYVLHSQVILLGRFFAHAHVQPLWEACAPRVKKESIVQTCSQGANLCRVSHCCFWKVNYWGPFWEASCFTNTNKPTPNTYWI